MAKGPLGNSPRDLRDEFVGEPVLYKGGEPPKKTRGPKKVTSNTFHSSVTGATSNKRADRAGHFRSGGFVRGKADGGKIEKPPSLPIERTPASMRPSMDVPAPKPEGSMQIGPGSFRKMPYFEKKKGGKV